MDQLNARLCAGRPLGETDDMAVVGMISTQLLHDRFVTNYGPSAPLGERDNVKVVNRTGAQAGQVMS